MLSSPSCGRAEGYLWSRFYKNTNPIMMAPPLWPNHCPKAPPQMASSCRLVFNTSIWREHIQTIAPSHLLLHGISLPHSCLALSESISWSKCRLPQTELRTELIWNPVQPLPPFCGDHRPGSALRPHRCSTALSTGAPWLHGHHQWSINVAVDLAYERGKMSPVPCKALKNLTPAELDLSAPVPVHVPALKVHQAF